MIQFPFIVYLLISCLALTGLSSAIIYPDFTVSMMREGRSLNNYEHSFIRKQTLGDFTNTKYVEIFRNNYARNIISAKCNTQEGVYRIPRIVHQIWLGSPVPEKYHNWMRSWMNWQGWEYMLWTDEDVKKMTLYNQELYDQAPNYGEKSDILRLELLLHFGGLYIDTDYECFKQETFEELHQCYDFYMGFEPLEHGLLDGLDMFKVCNALFASAPGHPLLENFITHMKANCIAHQHQWTVEKTGPAYLTNEIITYEQNPHNPDLRNMYLPATFFYPLSEPELRMNRMTRADIAAKLSPETAAVHYWSQSWLKEEGGCHPIYRPKEKQ